MQQRNDNFAVNVRKRLSISTDLVADEAVYHIQYYAQFFLNTSSADGNRGFPEFLKMQSVFNVTRYVWFVDEWNRSFHSWGFPAKMKEVSSDEVHGVKRIKQKLQVKYEENIFFAKVSGNKNIIFRNMADRIVSDQWFDNKRQNADNEAKRIIETAPKIIKSKLKQFLQ